MKFLQRIMAGNNYSHGNWDHFVWKWRQLAASSRIMNSYRNVNLDFVVFLIVCIVLLRVFSKVFIVFYGILGIYKQRN